MIYAGFSRLNHRNSFSRYRARLADAKERKKERKKLSQKIDDLPVLATCQSGASAMLSCKVNGPFVHGSTR